MSQSWLLRLHFHSLINCMSNYDIIIIIKYLWNFTCVKFFVASTLLSIASTKAAVFPVPDWDCAIMFSGLNIDWKKQNMKPAEIFSLVCPTWWDWSLDATYYSDIIFQILESHSWEDKAADGVADGTGYSREDSRQVKKRFRIWPKKRELDERLLGNTWHIRRPLQNQNNQLLLTLFQPWRNHDTKQWLGHTLGHSFMWKEELKQSFMNPLHISFWMFLTYN